MAQSKFGRRDQGRNAPDQYYNAATVKETEPEMTSELAGARRAAPARGWAFPLLLAGLILAAYAPAFNNGFISDDYVILGRLEDLKRDPLYLFSIPPETFRATCYACFALLKTLAGYRPEVFYAFTTALHLANAFMMWKLLGRLDAGRQAAALGAVLFAVYQNPQEGVMWLAGMNEALMTASVLGALLAWSRGRYVWFTLLCAAALFSKESGLVLLFLVPLADYASSGSLRFRKEYLLLAIPVIPFAAVYIATGTANALLSHRLYEVHARAVWVLINSCHRMLFPWGYLAFLVALAQGAREGFRGSIVPGAWVALCLLPYVFLTYQTHVPSRNQYLAAVGLAWLVASLISAGAGARWRAAYVTAFVCVNIAYLWLVKDPQYVARAAPTVELVAQLRSLEPQPVLVLHFPENPWIGANTALTVPGWQPSLIHVNEPAGACPSCPQLIWDPDTRRYLSPARR